MLYENIVLSGGTTMFKGIETRIKEGVVKDAPSGTKVNVIAEPKRNLLTWKGGSIMAS